MMQFREHRLPERLSSWVVLIGAASVLGAVLFARPIVGVADNGDYLRIMATVGFDYTQKLSHEQKYYGYMLREFAVATPGLGGYISTIIPVSFAAKALNMTMYSRDIFDIRFLAFIYSFMLILSLRLLLKGYGRLLGWAAVPLSAFLVFIFADAGYIAYFNSLYSEPASFLGVLLLIGSATAVIRSCRHAAIAPLAGFYLSALLLTGAKTQNAPLGILIALFGPRLASLWPDQRWKRTVYGLSCAIAVISMSLYALAPKELKHINLYQSVFYGVLKDSPAPERDAEELGLPERLAVNAGTNYFTKGAAIPQNDPYLHQTLYGKVTHADIALFYLKHPRRLYEKLTKAAEHGMTIRPYYLGNFEAGEGFARGAVTRRFGWWSDWKHRSMPRSVPFVTGFAVVFCAGVIRAWKRAASAAQRALPELWALVAGIGGVAFIVPVIGDGEADLSKHMFLFNVCFDCMLAASVGWALVYSAPFFAALRKAAVARSLRLPAKKG